MPQTPARLGVAKPPVPISVSDPPQGIQTAILAARPRKGDACARMSPNRAAVSACIRRATGVAPWGARSSSLPGYRFGSAPRVPSLAPGVHLGVAWPRGPSHSCLPASLALSRSGRPFGGWFAVEVSGLPPFANRQRERASARSRHLSAESWGGSSQCCLSRRSGCPHRAIGACPWPEAFCRGVRRCGWTRVLSSPSSGSTHTSTHC